MERIEKVKNFLEAEDFSDPACSIGSELFLMYVCLYVKEGRVSGKVFVTVGEEQFEVNKAGYITGFKIESAWDDVLKRLVETVPKF